MPESQEMKAAPLAYTIDDFAEATGFSRSFLYQEMNAGRLDFIKRGKRRAITAAQAAKYLEVAI